MTRWWGNEPSFDTTKKVVWGKACVSFVWRACAQALATQMSHTPRSVPPLKKCPTLQSLAVKKTIVQILGGEKLLKLVEKCRWNIFKRPVRAANNFSNTFRIVFRIFFRVFQPVFRIDLNFNSFSGAVSFCRYAALTFSEPDKSVTRERS